MSSLLWIVRCARRRPITLPIRVRDSSMCSIADHHCLAVNAINESKSIVTVQRPGKHPSHWGAAAAVEPCPRKLAAGWDGRVADCHGSRPTAAQELGRQHTGTCFGRTFAQPHALAWHAITTSGISVLPPCASCHASACLPAG